MTNNTQMILFLMAGGLLFTGSFASPSLTAQTPAAATKAEAGQKKDAPDPKVLETQRQERLRNAYEQANAAIREKQYPKALSALETVEKNLIERDAYDHLMRIGHTLRNIPEQTWKDKAREYYAKALARAKDDAGKKASALTSTASLQSLEEAEKTIQPILKGAEFTPQQKYNAQMEVLKREPSQASFEKACREKLLPIAGKNPDLLHSVYQAMSSRYVWSDRDHAIELIEECLKNPAMSGPAKVRTLWVLADYTLDKDAKRKILKPVLEMQDLSPAQRRDTLTRLTKIELNPTKYMTSLTPDEYRSALAYCFEILKLKKEPQTNNYLLMSEIYLGLDDPENAGRYAQEVLDMKNVHPQNAYKAWEILGDCARKRGESVKASKAYRKATELSNDRDILLLEKLAKIQMSLREYPAVLETLEKMKKAPGRYDRRRLIDSYIDNVKKRMAQQ